MLLSNSILDNAVDRAALENFIEGMAPWERGIHRE
jgi:hypothetical protein